MPEPLSRPEVPQAVGLVPLHGDAKGAAWLCHLPDPHDLRVLRVEPGRAAKALRGLAVGTVSAIVLDGQLAGADVLALMEAVDLALHEGASTLVVIDRFSVQRAPRSEPGALSLEHVAALLRRMGWTVEVLSADVSAAPPVVGEAPAERLVDASLIARRDRLPAMRLVRVDAEKSAAMRQLFERVFHAPLSAQRWQWKYGQGRGVAVGLWCNDELVAHYGGFTRRVLFHGRPEKACQVGDVMVLPSANTSLSRSGPMAQVGATFAAFEVGYGLPHLVGFGFPNARAFAVARRLQLYGQVDEVVQVEWTPLQAAPRQLPLAERIDRQALGRPGVARALGRCWSAMAAALPDAIVGVRDAAWIGHRYLEHPETTYDVWRLRSRWLRRELGWVVLRRHEHHLELLDLVARPDRFARLLSFARHRAACEGHVALRCWVTRSHVALLVPPGASAGSDAPRVEDIGVHVPTTIHTEGPPLESLVGRWWLMGGDADFT